MHPLSWKQIFTIFEEAVELPPDERRRFLDQACGDSEDIRLCRYQTPIGYDEKRNFDVDGKSKERNTFYLL